MPETTEQVEGGGSKVADRWPRKVLLHKPPGVSRVHIAPSGPAPGFEANWENETETYIPVSALLSDEAIDKATRVLADLDRPFGPYKERVRAAFKAAIDHLGGTDAH